MDVRFLERVLIYLQQELPGFKDDMSISNEVVVFRMPVGQDFSVYYDGVFSMVSSCVARIRNLDHDLDFSVRSPNQERDFRLYKRY